MWYNIKAFSYYRSTSVYGFVTYYSKEPLYVETIYSVVNLLLNT